MASYNDYDDRLTDEGNIAIALLSIAEALEKLANAHAQPEQDLYAVFKRELTNIADKITSLRLADPAPDIEQIQKQTAQIAKDIALIKELLLKKESP